MPTSKSVPVGARRAQQAECRRSHRDSRCCLIGIAAAAALLLVSADISQAISRDDVRVCQQCHTFPGRPTICDTRLCSSSDGCEKELFDSDDDGVNDSVRAVCTEE